MKHLDIYGADKKRYERMTYNRVGRSGLKFPAVSLGFWHNFGSKDNYDNMRLMCRTAFDHGLRCLIWQIITGLYMEVRKKVWEDL